MTKETIFCDRCGKECEKFKTHGLWISRKKFRLTKFCIATYRNENVDMCQECYDELDKWFKQK